MWKRGGRKSRKADGVSSAVLMKKSNTEEAVVKQGKQELPPDLSYRFIGVTLDIS